MPKQTTEYRPIYRTCGEKEKAAAAKIKLKPGLGEADDLQGAQKQMCIMQMLAFVTGQEKRGADGAIIKVTDHPICVSRQITDLCIQINDSYDGASPAKLAKLKAALPVIQGTAPIREKIVTKHLASGKKVIVTQETDSRNPTYNAAEKKRAKMIDEARNGLGEWGRHNRLLDEPEDWLTDTDVPMSQKIKFIEALANVAKFNYPQEA